VFSQALYQEEYTSVSGESEWSASRPFCSTP